MFSSVYVVGIVSLDMQLHRNYTELFQLTMLRLQREARSPVTAVFLQITSPFAFTVFIFQPVSLL